MAPRKHNKNRGKKKENEKKSNDLGLRNLVKEKKRKKNSPEKLDLYCIHTTPSALVMLRRVEHPVVSPLSFESALQSTRYVLSFFLYRVCLCLAFQNCENRDADDEVNEVHHETP